MQTISMVIVRKDVIFLNDYCMAMHIGQNLNHNDVMEANNRGGKTKTVQSCSKLRFLMASVQFINLSSNIFLYIELKEVN